MSFEESLICSTLEYSEIISWHHALELQWQWIATKDGGGQIEANLLQNHALKWINPGIISAKQDGGIKYCQ